MTETKGIISYIIQGCGYELVGQHAYRVTTRDNLYTDWVGHDASVIEFLEWFLYLQDLFN